MDVRSHYKSHTIACSLKTRSRKMALRAASALSLQLDDYWMTLRVSQLTSIHCKILKVSPDQALSGITLLDAKDLYRKLKGKGKPDKKWPEPQRHAASNLADAPPDKQLPPSRSP